MNAVHRALAVFAILSFGAVAHGAQFLYDPALTNGGLMVNGVPGISAYGTTTLFGFPTTSIPYSASPPSSPPLVASYSQPSGTYDWGNEAIGSAQVLNSESSSDSFVTYNGDGTNQITVRVDGEALLKSDSPPDPLDFSAIRLDGTGSVGFTVASALLGLAPGQPYVVHYTWDVDASSGGDFAASAFGQMRAFTPSNPPPTTVFDTGIATVQGDPSTDITPNGSGNIFGVFDPANPDFFVELSVYGTSSGQTDDPTASILSAANFFGEATFTIEAVPEPASIVSMVIGAAILLLCLPRIRRCISQSSHGIG